MAYNSAIPQPTDQISVSQGQLLANFQAISTFVNVNHVDFASPDQGKHKFVTMPSQGAAPAFLATEIGLFNQNAVPTVRNDLWMARGAGTPFPITGYANGIVGAVLANAAVSWTYLPSGLKIISGQNTTSGGTLEITFNNTAAGGLTGFPGFSSFISSIQVVRIDNSGSSTTVMRVKSFTLTKATFGLANGSTDSTFFWSVMGL